MAAGWRTRVLWALAGALVVLAVVLSLALRGPVRALADWALAHLDHIDAARESFDATEAA